MKYVVDQVFVEVGAHERVLKNAILKRLGIGERNFRYEVLDQQYVVDGSRAGILYKVEIETTDFVRDTTVRFVPDVSSFTIPGYDFPDRPVVVGAGLAGLFAAYVLSLSGARPILLEKGADLTTRKEQAENFEATNRFTEIPFGRNGLGGYLAMTGCRFVRREFSLRERWIFRQLSDFGISRLTYHHVFLSSQQVSDLCLALKKGIESRGGEIICNAEFMGIRSFLGKIKEARVRIKGNEEAIPTAHVILSGGEANIPLLKRVGVTNKERELKGLAFMIERPTSEFCSATYGTPYPDPSIPPVFVFDQESKFAISHFYPGVAPVFMGMAEKTIDIGLNMNKKGELAGITMVTLFPGKDDASRLAGFDLATAAFKPNIPYACPSESLKDFISGKEPLRMGSFKAAYRKGVYLADLNALFQNHFGPALREALGTLVKKAPFYSDGRALIYGLSLTFENGYELLGEGNPETNVRGLYCAAPKDNFEYCGNDVAQAGIEAALALLNGK